MWLRVEYPLCRANPYAGYCSLSPVMMRSRVTLATIEAAATQAATSSPFHMARAGTPRPRTAKPSVSTYPGRMESPASARRIPAMLQTCSPHASISAAGMMTRCQLRAVRITSVYASSRAAAVSVLESATPLSPESLRGSRTTAATTSGPAQAPRPASSIPATGDRPARARTRSYPVNPAARRGV